MDHINSETSLFKKIYERWEAVKPERDLYSNEEELWKKKAEMIDEMIMQKNVVLFLSNIFTNRFIYMSDKLKTLSNIDASSYLGEGGLDFSLSRLQPEQVEAITQAYLKAIRFLSENSHLGYKELLICQNYLYKNGNGVYEQVQQVTGVLETDSSGQPLITINFIHYIGHIKKADSLTLATISPKEIRIYSYNQEVKQLEERIISEQEKKVIRLLAQGYDSKTIAEKLFISPNTVDTHRRNVIKKTDCIDTTGVVAYAKLINLI